MSRKYKFGDPGELYFVSFAVINWIDVFVRKEYNDIVIKSLEYCQEKKGLEVYGWVIMPSHVHLIISSLEKGLEDIMRDMKSHTSTAMRNQITQNKAESRREWMLWMMERAGKKNSNNNDWQFWQQNNEPILIKDAAMFHRTLDYTHENPVVAGFVERAEHWLYSSAGDFYGKKGLIELSYIV